ncbi:hypothetical protein CPHLJ_3g1750 [Cryptosporidium parvum]
MLFLWLLTIFFVFIGGINENKEILNHNIKLISFLHAEGGKDLRSSSSSPLTKETSTINSDDEELSLPSSWFIKKLESNAESYLESIGIGPDLTSKESCTESQLKKLLKELKKSLKKLILTNEQVKHYNENNSSGKYSTASFQEYLTEKKQEISMHKQNIESLLEQILKCLMLLRLDKYSRKIFKDNSVNCNAKTYTFTAVLKTTSKRVLSTLKKLLHKFDKEYKNSTKNITATFDHSTLSASVQTLNTLITKQKDITRKIKHKKKKCKMYMEFSSRDISTLL